MAEFNIFDLIAATMRGEELYVSPEKVEERLKICSKCEHLFKPTYSCKKCLCFMKIKAKIAPTVCSIGKWGSEVM